MSLLTTVSTPKGPARLRTFRNAGAQAVDRTGCEDSSVPGCFSISPPPVMPCNVKGTCTEMDPGAGYYGTVDKNRRL